MKKMPDDENKYKLALFMVIRNSIVLPKGMALNKTKKEINQKTCETMHEVLSMINWKQASEMYEEGVTNE